MRADDEQRKFDCYAPCFQILSLSKNWHTKRDEATANFLTGFCVQEEEEERDGGGGGWRPDRTQYPTNTRQPPGS